MRTVQLCLLAFFDALRRHGHFGVRAVLVFFFIVVAGGQSFLQDGIQLRLNVVRVRVVVILDGAGARWFGTVLVVFFIIIGVRPIILGRVLFAVGLILKVLVWTVTVKLAVGFGAELLVWFFLGCLVSAHCVLDESGDRGRSIDTIRWYPVPTGSEDDQAQANHGGSGWGGAASVGRPESLLLALAFRLEALQISSSGVVNECHHLGDGVVPGNVAD